MGVDGRTRGSLRVFGDGRQAGGGRCPENPASPCSAPQLPHFPEEGVEDAGTASGSAGWAAARGGGASAALPAICSDPF